MEVRRRGGPLAVECLARHLHRHWRAVTHHVVGAMSVITGGLGLEDLEEARHAVVEEAMAAPERRLDNTLTWLYVNGQAEEWGWECLEAACCFCVDAAAAGVRACVRACARDVTANLVLSWFFVCQLRLCAAPRHALHNSRCTCTGLALGKH